MGSRLILIDGQNNFNRNARPNKLLNYNRNKWRNSRKTGGYEHSNCQASELSSCKLVLSLTEIWKTTKEKTERRLEPTTVHHNKCLLKSESNFLFDKKKGKEKWFQIPNEAKPR